MQQVREVGTGCKSTGPQGFRDKESVWTTGCKWGKPEMGLGPVKQAGHPGPERLSSLEFNNTVSQQENIGICKLWGNFSWARKLS